MPPKPLKPADDFQTEEGLARHERCAALLEEPAPQVLRTAIAEIRRLRALLEPPGGIEDRNEWARYLSFMNALAANPDPDHKEIAALLDRIARRYVVAGAELITLRAKVAELEAAQAEQVH